MPAGGEEMGCDVPGCLVTSWSACSAVQPPTGGVAWAPTAPTNCTQVGGKAEGGEGRRRESKRRSGAALEVHVGSTGWGTHGRTEASLHACGDPFHCLK